MPRQPRDNLTLLGSYLENELDQAALENPDPGRMPAVHRLNRSEYANAVRDLLGVKVGVRNLLLADDAAHGFDNVADVLAISPVLFERYVAAAE